MKRLGKQKVLKEKFVSQFIDNLDVFSFAFIKLSEVINKSSNNSETLKADVFSTSYPNELIAFLNIRIVGFSFLRVWSKEK